MSDAMAVRGAHAPAGVAAAREALLAWVDGAGAEGRVFLQAHLRATGAGRYEARHARDAGRPLDALAVSPDPFAAREIAQTTDAGEHRPLKTSPNLRGGWALVGLDGRGLWTALDYLYPACAAHWHAGRTGTLRPTHWRETAGRQSGIYSPVKLLPDAAVRNTVRACCGDAVCLRRVAWEIDAETPLGMVDEGPPAGDAPVPCPEACSVFVSFARKVLTLERAPRREVPGLAPMSAAELEQLREVVAAAAGGTPGVVREGEFDAPTNPRRVRYLAARLAEAAADREPAEAAADREPAEAAADREPAEAAELPCEGCPRATPCAACPLAAA